MTVLRMCICIILVTVIASCGRNRSTPVPASEPSSQALRVAIIQTRAEGGAINHLAYSGHWEFVRGRHDGRFAGESARSFHAGDALTLIYQGEAFRVFGVTGPNGGQGEIIIPGMTPQTVDFRSARRRTHVLIYASPPATPGVHSAGLVVTRAGDGLRGYVNVDEVQVLRRPS
jgi:hypothetical protein